MLVVVGIDFGLEVRGGKFVQLLLYSARSGIGIVATHVDSLTRLCYLAAHILVEFGHHHISGSVLAEVIRSRNRNRATVRFTDTYDKHLNSLFYSGFRGCECIVLVILTVGNKNDRAGHFLIRFAKSTDGRHDSVTNSCALRFNHVGRDSVQEHLRAHIIAGDRQLDIRLAGKNYQSHFVVHHVIDELAEHLFSAVQTVRRHVLCQHRIGYIERNHDLDTLPLDGFLFLTVLRTGNGDNQ